MPVVLTMIPQGLLINPFVPTPFTDPLVVPVTPPPAIVMTLRFEKTARILLLLKSATYKMPDEPMATPNGFSNPTFVPTPLLDPKEVPDAPPPATVTTLCGIAGLLKHADAPSVGVKVPTGHGVHDAAPKSLENVPAAQGGHSK